MTTPHLCPRASLQVDLAPRGSTSLWLRGLLSLLLLCALTATANAQPAPAGDRPLPEATPTDATAPADGETEPGTEPEETAEEAPIDPELQRKLDLLDEAYQHIADEEARYRYLSGSAMIGGSLIVPILAFRADKILGVLSIIAAAPAFVYGLVVLGTPSRYEETALGYQIIKKAADREPEPEVTWEETDPPKRTPDPTPILKTIPQLGPTMGHLQQLREASDEEFAQIAERRLQAMAHDAASTRKWTGAAFAGLGAIGLVSLITPSSDQKNLGGSAIVILAGGLGALFYFATSTTPETAWEIYQHKLQQRPEPTPQPPALQPSINGELGFRF